MQTSEVHSTTGGRLLYTVAEAGKLLGQTTWQTRELIKAGALVAVRQPNGRIYITPDALTTYVASLPVAEVDR